MNVIRCKNGHFFDGDSYGTCPHCGEAAMSAGPAVTAKEEKKSFWGRGRKEKEPEVQHFNNAPVFTGNFGNGNTPTDVMEKKQPSSQSTPPLKKNPTLDFWQTSSHPESQTGGALHDSKEDSDQIVETANEVSVVAEKANSQPGTPNEEPQREERHVSAEPVSSLREAVKNASASNEGKTMSYFSSATSSASNQGQSKPTTEPVVGWLVCVGGCHFGECFSIFAGKNAVGRSGENRIVIPKDNSISRVKHALIVYEPKKRNFYLQPGDSSGLTYLNEEYITESHKLAAHDIIELNDSKFMFVPLCGERFSWEDHMPKGE